MESPWVFISVTHTLRVCDLGFPRFPGSVHFFQGERDGSSRRPPKRCHGKPDCGIRMLATKTRLRHIVGMDQLETGCYALQMFAICFFIFQVKWGISSTCSMTCADSFFPAAEAPGNNLPDLLPNFKKFATRYNLITSAKTFNKKVCDCSTADDCSDR